MDFSWHALEKNRNVILVVRETESQKHENDCRGRERDVSDISFIPGTLLLNARNQMNSTQIPEEGVHYGKAGH